MKTLLRKHTGEKMSSLIYLKLIIFGFDKKYTILPKSIIILVFNICIQMYISWDQFIKEKF